MRVVDLGKKASQGLKVLHQFWDTPALPFSLDDICEALSSSLAHNNQVMCMTRRTPAAKYLQRESKVPVIGEIWVLCGKLQKVLRLRRNH